MNRFIISAALLSVSNSAFSTPTLTNFLSWDVGSDMVSTQANHSVIEDDGHRGYLNPGHGGQDYDAEALYTSWDADYLYIGLMTGRAQGCRRMVCR